MNGDVPTRDTLSDTFSEYWLRIDIPDSTVPASQVKEIEEDIVTELVKRHSVWMQQSVASEVSRKV